MLVDNQQVMKNFCAIARENNHQKFWLVVTGAFGLDTLASVPLEMVGPKARPLDLLAEVKKLQDSPEPEQFEVLLFGKETDEDSQTLDNSPLYLKAAYVCPVFLPGFEARLHELLGL